MRNVHVAGHPACLGCRAAKGRGSEEREGGVGDGGAACRASPNSVLPKHALHAATKIVTFSQGGHTLSKKVMEDLRSEERRSVVEESSSMVLSLQKREGVGAHRKALSERVRRLSDCALQIGLECSRRATHKWLSQALKGGAGPAHRWCGKEDALAELPLVIRNSQGNFTADPQCVAERYAHEWKRERGGEDATGFNKETSSIRALREKHVEEARDWQSGLAVRKCSQSFSLFPVQDGDRLRPARIQRRRTPP